MRILLTLTFYSLFFIGNAQNDQGALYYSPPIRIDSVSHKTSDPLPFDRAFILQYPFNDSLGPLNLAVYVVDVKNGQRNVLQTSPGVVVPAPYLDKFWMSGTTLNIQIKPMPPNTLIDILILGRMNATQLKELMLVNADLYASYHGNPGLKPGALARYNRLTPSLGSTLYPATNRSVSKYTDAQYDAFYLAQLEGHYHTLATYNYTNGSPAITAAQCTHAAGRFNTAEIPLTRLLHLSRNLTTIDDVMKGERRLGALRSGDFLAIATAYDERVANITASIAVINQLIYDVDEALLQQVDATLQSLATDLQTLSDILHRNKTAISTEIKAIKEKMTGNVWISRDDWLMSGNDLTDLAIKSKFLLVPDLGLVTMFLGARDNVKAVPRPFIGTNIYLRPVDKTIRERSLAKKDWRRLLSLQLGLTYGSFGNPEFSNLFNDFSLLIGPSYKLNRSFRFSAGTVLYKTSDKNPIITGQKVAFSVYGAFSFDLDILSNSGIARARILK